MALHRYNAFHLVRKQDLNMHGTLIMTHFSEWFLDSAIINLSLIVDPHLIYCQKVHGYELHKPVFEGDLLRFESVLIESGHSMLMVYVRVTDARNPKSFISEGVLSYKSVDKDIQGVAHHIIINPEGPEDAAIQEKGRSLAHKLF
ncbi:MAG: hypothetical protein ACRC6R_01480 [Bacteroidales bacterium]